jgi:hypothetical protein
LSFCATRATAPDLVPPEKAGTTKQRKGLARKRARQFAERWLLLDIAAIKIPGDWPNK